MDTPLIAYMENLSMKPILATTLIFTVTILPHGALGDESSRSQHFFLDKERGWFWREELTEPVEPKIKKKVDHSPSPADSSVQPTPAPFSVAWLRSRP